MGRDVTGLRIDKKASEKSSDSSRAAIHVAPKGPPEKTVVDDEQEPQDLPTVKSTNDVPEENILKTEVHESPDKKGTIRANHANGARDDDSGVKILSKPTDLDSPQPGKKIQTSTHIVSRKQMYDDEDNWSLASSTATSIRTKITVPVAPRFSCVDRMQRRKEFYTKLEEKHKALEKEKLEYEARIKEEELSAIKQLRKSMVVKAKPVPSFYHEGPPPKAELKKVPVTRAKSPNLTRRKSFGDAEDKKACGRAARHSVGSCKEGKSSSPVVKKASPVTPKSANWPKKMKNQQPKGTCAQDPPENGGISVA